MKKRLKIGTNYSLNFNIPKRNAQKIKFIILHYTGMKKEKEAIKKLCDTNPRLVLIILSKKMEKRVPKPH